MELPNSYLLSKEYAVERITGSQPPAVTLLDPLSTDTRSRISRQIPAND